jgi:PAS domain S-box-containing protein
MNWQPVIYLVPYLISVLISAGIGLYAWRRRTVPGATPFALAALAEAQWTLCYVFELLSPGLQAKIFWDNVQWVGMLLWCPAFLALALQYTGRKLSHLRRTWGLLTAVSVIFMLLVLTNDLHGLIWPEAWLVPGEPFPALVYDFTLSVWALTLYSYALILVSVSLLVVRFIRAQVLYRAQVGTVVLGSLIPVVGTIFTMLEIAPSFHRDMTPFTFAMSNLVIAWGLFRYWLLDIVPVAHDRVIENMSDAVLVLDAQDRVIDLNPAAQEIAGHATSKVIGQPVAQALAHQPDLVEWLHSSEPARAEIVLGTKGERRHFDVSVSPLVDHHGHLSGRLVVLRDVTGRVRAETALRELNATLEAQVEARTAELQRRATELEATLAELREAQDRLVRSERLAAIGEMATSVAHELRNPLNTIRVSTFFVRQKLAQADAPVRESLERIEKQVVASDKIIHDLLAFARVRPPNLCPTDVNQLVQAALEGSAVPREVTVVTCLANKLPSVPLDAHQMERVLLNLITNAVQAMTLAQLDRAPAETPPGRQLEVRAWEEEKTVLVSVADTGVGIPSENLARIFEPLFTTKARGTGLGLAICRRIVEAHGGDIEVESRVGKGSTFTVRLPVDNGQKAA